MRTVRKRILHVVVCITAVYKTDAGTNYRVYNVMKMSLSDEIYLSSI